MILELVGIAVTVVSIIVTVISIRQTRRNKGQQETKIFHDKTTFKHLTEANRCFTAAPFLTKYLSTYRHFRQQFFHTKNPPVILPDFIRPFISWKSDFGMRGESGSPHAHHFISRITRQVYAISPSVCASDTNIASNWEGAV